MPTEKTLFFIKPYIDPEKAAEIIRYRNELLTHMGTFETIEQFETPPLLLEFWLDFYSQIGQKYPEVLKKMTNDFASCPHGLTGDVLEGEGIIDKVRNTLGGRIIENNESWQIRSATKYGLYNNRKRASYRTVAHASTKDPLPSGETQVKKDFRIFRREGITKSSI